MPEPSLSVERSIEVLERLDYALGTLKSLIRKLEGEAPPTPKQVIRQIRHVKMWLDDAEERTG